MTETEAKKALTEIWEAGLYGRDFVHRLTIEQFASACNGIGPARWPAERRAKLDKWLAVFRRAADVHDCRFTYDNDGTRQSFDMANDELEKNCLILANLKYAWYNPVRYFARHGAHLIGAACREFGWEAYDEAFGKTHNQEEMKCTE